ncbi:MAG: hypothetical protein Q9162_003740 [Coniocarpon cinnabarinum]
MASQTDHDLLGAWATIKGPDANVDRHGSKRTVPMEVLSLGMSRTGTLSMQEALSTLGFPDPYHYAMMFTNVKDADMWVEALRSKYKNGPKRDWRQHFDQLLCHCGAVTDTPSAVFWKELMDAYPDAKVVLVQRDEEKWLKSAYTLLDGMLTPMNKYVLYYLDPWWHGRVAQTGFMWGEGFFGSLDAATAKRNARAAYRQHYENIRAYAGPGRILEYELGSGWEPLCEFLGKPVPDTPFPHRNEQATLQLAFSAFAGRALKHAAFNLAVVVGVGAVIASVVQQYIFA